MFIFNGLISGARQPQKAAVLTVASFVLISYSSHNPAAISSISMTTNVVANCKFTSGNSTLNFGSYDPGSNNVTEPLNSSVTFSLRCSKGSNATISISDGMYGTANTRRMRSSNYYLEYNLFRDSGHNSRWDTTNTANYAANSSLPQTFTIYGQLPAGQTNVGVGSYSDTVTITVTF